MSKRHARFAGAILPLAIFWTLVSAMPVEGKRMLLGCRIDVAADGDAIRVEAVAHSRENVRGSYQFALHKSSASGTSRNMQSGNFDLQANQEKILSTVFLSASDADHFQAQLVLNSNTGSVSCVTP